MLSILGIIEDFYKKDSVSCHGNAAFGRLCLLKQIEVFQH